MKKTGHTLAVTAAMGAAPAIGVAGANEKINLGFVGAGGRGAFHVREFSEMKDVNLVAVSDASQEKMNRVRAAFPQVQVVRDFRKLLESKDIDAVVVSTPDQIGRAHV